MSIRSRIATFEARNEELRRATEPYVPVGAKQPPAPHTPALSEVSTAPSSPEDALLAAAIVNKSNNSMARMPPAGSVAGRFGATQPARYSSASKPASTSEAPPSRKQQRYQPLHQQYQMRQQQRQKETDEDHHSRVTDDEPTQPVATTSLSRGAVAKRSPHRRAAHYRTRLEQMRRVEDSQRRLHESQQQQGHDDRHQQSSMEKATTHSESTVAYRTSKTTTAQRLVKMQRMKQARMRNESQQHPQEEQRSSPEPLPRDLSLQNSATADDDITLTSVRQIVGNTAETAAPAESVPLDEPGHASYSRGYDDHRYHHHGPPPPDEMTYNHDDWPEEKSDKDHVYRRSTKGGMGVHHSSGMNNDASQYATASHSMQEAPSYYEDNRLVYPNSSHNDGQHDELSQGSESFAQRKERERLEQEARDKAVEQAKAEMQGPFLKAEDVEHYQKSIDTPIVKTAAGVAVAATLGCVVLGPMGLLVGAAAVGLGFGVMQIPVEQRRNLEEKATHTLKQVSETAMQASESMSSSCVNTYRDSGLAEHVPEEVNNCCGAIPEPSAAAEKSEISATVSAGGDMEAKDPVDVPEGADLDRSHTEELPKKDPPKRAGAACLRAGTYTPVNMIYTLNPQDQPRAWLDVLASAEAGHDEKSEALEEIVILAKDKSRARTLVEEGILDSLLWTLGRHFEKLHGPEDGSQNWTHPDISPEDARIAKLSANCCLQLGKAYCAAMHTDGDLMLMSLYERGTVPEERQLAQMLHEVPYHTRVTKTKDPTVVDPEAEVFAVVQMSLPQAEDFARSVKALAHGGNSYSM